MNEPPGQSVPHGVCREKDGACVTGQERGPGGILGKENGCAVPCIPVVPRFPSVRCQPRWVSRSSPALPSSHSSLPKSSSPISQSPSACPMLCPTLPRTSKPCWKIPLHLSCFHSYAPLEPRATLQPLRSICSTVMWGGQWFLPCPQPPALPCEQRDLAFPSTPARRSLSRQARQKSLCHLCLGKGKAQGTRWRGEQGTDLAGRLTSLLGEVARKAKGRR